MQKALLVIVVVFLMIVSMSAVASALPANIIPAKNGTSTMQPNGYYRSGLPSPSSNVQSSPLAKLSTNSGGNKLGSLLHNFNSPVESPTQSNLQGPYKVTFTETGLPTGMPWQVEVESSNFPISPLLDTVYNMSFGIVNSSSGTSITFSLANGSYIYYTGPTSTYLGPYYFNVTGNPVSITFPFPAFYKVTFTESGLPSGMSWNVMSLNNSSAFETPTYYNITSSSSMVSYLPNGNYALFAGPRSTYLMQKGFTVNGAALSLQVVFPNFYKVTFTEVNLNSGEPWILIANNTTSSTSYYVLYFNFSNTVSRIAYLPNGGYYYRAMESFFSGSSISGSFIVNNASETIKVIFPVTYKVTFTEKNLPAGADWSVSVFNNNRSMSYYNTSSTSSMIAYLPNGTYNYSANFGSIMPPMKEFNVTGLPLSFTVIFPVTYKVTITEKNLPAGADWSVSAFNNSHSVNYYNTSTGSSMIAYLPYGTYNYTGNFNGVATPLHEFNVTGVSIAINVVFPEKYSVVFTETGLPTGTVWEVSVNNLTTGNSFNSSSTSTITFSLYNGSYTYNVTTSLSGWKPSSPSGKFIVPGSTVNVPTVTFSTTDHNVQFKESGMPTGTSWYVIFNGTEEISTSNNITFYIPNGNYTYTLQTPVPGSTGIRYVVSPSSGNVNVSGHNLSKNVSYSTQYHLTIDTSPAGTGTVSPSSSWFSAGSSVTLTAQAYSGYNFSSWSGSGTGSYTGTNNPATLTMSGPISETANFVQTTVYHYTTTFTESGLPSGTTWYVNLSNGFDSGAITGTSYSFSLANGSYSYTIATTDKTYEPSPSTGSFKVNAGPVSISVSFSDVKYKVTFKETGLPSGSSWNITFNGVTISSTNSTITFSALNGTYSFSASNSSSYYTVNYSGSISVKGNSVSTSIIYYHYAYISGTVNPSNATVDINGHSVKVTGSGSFNVSEASGTYSIVISESGYSTYYSNVTLTAGQTKELNVTLNPVKSPATPSIPPLELYGIVGAMVAIVAVVAAVSLMRKKH